MRYYEWKLSKQAGFMLPPGNGNIVQRAWGGIKTNVLKPAADSMLQKMKADIQARSDKIDRSRDLHQKLYDHEMKRGDRISFEDTAKGSKKGFTIIRQGQPKWGGQFSRKGVENVDPDTFARTLNLHAVKDENGKVTSYMAKLPVSVISPDGKVVFSTTKQDIARKVYKPEDLDAVRALPWSGGLTVFDVKGGNQYLPKSLVMHESNGPRSHAANEAARAPGTGLTNLDDTKLSQLIAPERHNSILGDEFRAYSPENGTGWKANTIGRSNYWNNALNSVALRLGPKVIDAYKKFFS